MWPGFSEYCHGVVTTWHYFKLQASLAKHRRLSFLVLAPVLSLPHYARNL
jgi:hypothetical protein